MAVLARLIVLLRYWIRLTPADRETLIVVARRLAASPDGGAPPA